MILIYTKLCFHVTQHSREEMVFISLWQPSDGQLMSWIQLKIDNKKEEMSWTLNYVDNEDEYFCVKI